MRIVLIVGASRGIGLGRVDVYLEPGWHIHATTRDGLTPRDHTDLTAYRFEVREQGELEDLITDLPGTVDRVIHNAGVLRAPQSELMEVNAVAPIRTVDRGGSGATGRDHRHHDLSDGGKTGTVGESRRLRGLQGRPQ